MLFCDQCGKQLIDGAKFCQFCGNQINTDFQNDLSEESPTIPQYYFNSSDKLNNSNDFHNVHNLNSHNTVQFPPVIDGLSRKIKTKIIAHSIIGAIDIPVSAVCLNFGAEYALQLMEMNESTDSDVKIQTLVLTIVFLLIAAVFVFVAVLNFYSAYKDFTYRKSMLAYPVGIIKKYENKGKTGMLLFAPITSSAYTLIYDSIQEYIELNKDLFVYIGSWFSANNPNKFSVKDFTEEEQQQINAAFTAVPKQTPKRTIHYIRVIGKSAAVSAAYLLLALVIYIYAKPYSLFTFTAEEYVSFYNQTIAFHKYDTPQIDFSRVEKRKNTTNDLYCSFPLNEDKNEDILYLFIDGDKYYNNVKAIKYIKYADSANDEISSGIIYQIQTLYGNLSYDEIKTLCQSVKQYKELSPEQTPEIKLTYEFNQEKKAEIWWIYPCSSANQKQSISLSEQSTNTSFQSSQSSVSETPKSTSGVYNLSFSAEEFANKYNDSARVQSMVDTINFDTAQKNKINDKVVSYGFTTQDNHEAILLYLEEYNYSSDVGLVQIVADTNNKQSSMIPYSVTNTIMTIFDDCTYSYAAFVCQQVKQNGIATDGELPGIEIYFSDDDEDDFEYWYILLPNRNEWIGNLKNDLSETSEVSDTSNTPNTSSSEEKSEPSKSSVSESSAQTLPSGTIYSDRIQKYNGNVYYSSVFSAQGDSGFFDFSSAKSSYQKLPIPSDSIQIDSFIIVNDTVFFADRQAGTGSYMPSTVYQMNLDGTGLTQITNNVDINFKYENGTIKLSPIDASTGKPSINNHYIYDITTGNLTSDSYYIDTNRSNTILPYKGTSSSSEFDGGTFYIGYEYVTVNNTQYNMVYYRQDTATGQNDIIGYAFNPAA